jgi:hypothetical protein
MIDKNNSIKNIQNHLSGAAKEFGIRKSLCQANVTKSAEFLYLKYFRKRTCFVF